MTTDPIEQAREKMRQGEAAGYEWIGGCDPDQLAWFEQAILRYHPDVVRLVLAARVLAEEARFLRTHALCDHTEPLGHIHAVYDALMDAHAALVPFTEVQE